MPTGVPSQTGGPATSDATGGQLPGGSSTDSALVSRAGLSRKDDIQVVTARSEGTEKPLASVPGPAPSGDHAVRSASPFHQSRRAPAAGRIGLRTVPAPLAAGQRVSLPSSIDLTDTWAFPRVPLPGAATGAPSPGSVALPAVLEIKLPAAPRTLYPVPEGFVDKEVLIELRQPIVDAPVLDASKLALPWTCRPRRGVSVVDLEKLSGDGPIRADMSPLRKVGSCNQARADAAVGLMMANGRYAIPSALECDREFLHEPRNAAYL